MRIAARPTPRRPIQPQRNIGLQPGIAAGAAKTAATTVKDPETLKADQAKSLFQKQFSEAAADPKQFHALMKQVFGEGYDKKLAEQYRQQALSGDFSFLPEVKFVDAKTLGGANGAYDANAGVVYLNQDLPPGKAAQTFVEEAGHHLDAKLNKTDSPGDEGELFRRILGGENLSKAEIREIRAENDKGTITVDGKQIEVEFWNPFKAIKKAAKAVGSAVSGAAKAVGNAVSGAAKAVGSAVSGAAKAVGNAVGNAATGVFEGIKSVGKGIVGAATTVFDGVKTGIGGFFGNLVQGKIGDAFGSLVNGADKIFFQAPHRLVAGVAEGVQNAWNGATELLGPLGKPIRAVTDRAFDIGRTAIDTSFDVARDMFRLPLEVGVGFVKDMESTVKLIAEGKWEEAAKQFGMAFVNAPKRAIGGAADAVIRTLQGAASIVQTAIGLEPPARSLNPQERAYLESIYGDSIDYDMIRVKPGGALNDKMAAHVVGNTIYMPSKYFKDDGTLTQDGLNTLGHEAGHIWQNQNGGGDYIHKALLAQAAAAIDGGSRNGAYDWRDALADGTAFEDMNPEQQASVAESIGIALQNDGVVDLNDGFSQTQLDFLLETWKKIRAGQGAP